MNSARRPLVDLWVWDVVVAIAATNVAIFGAKTITPVLPLLTPDEGSALSAVVGVHAAILGFVLAALSITAGYAQSDRFALVRESGQLTNLYGIYIAAALTEIIALSLALVALVTRLPEPFHLSLILSVVGSTVLSIIRLSRTIWITSAVTRATAQSGDRAAGAR